MVDHRRRLISRLLAVPVVAVLSFAGWSTANFFGQGPNADETTVVLPRGAGVSMIAKALEEAGVISSPFVFRSGVRISGNSRALKAGEYLIPRRTSPRGIMELLLAGRTVSHRLTIAEGLTVAEVFAAVHAVEGLEGELLKRPPEGTLLPETYYFSLGDSRAELLTRMGENSRMAVTGDLTQVGLPRGMLSGLRDALRVLADIRDIEIVHFTAADVVRHRLVSRIVKAYDARDGRQEELKLGDDPNDGAA